MIALLTYGLAAGAFAALNPCGFAMLPAVISRYLNQEQRSAPLIEGVKLGGLLTLGTLTAFGVIGLILSTFGTGLAKTLPFVNLLLGLALLVMAVLTFAGRPPTLRLTRLQAPGGQGLREFYPFGVAYGLASLGCTLPIFLLIVGGAATRTPLERALMFGAYGLGMGGVLLAVSVASALGKDTVIRAFRRAGRHLDFVSGLGLLLAGAYMLYYQTRFIEQFFTGNTTTLPLQVGVSALLISAAAARVLYVKESRTA